MAKEILVSYGVDIDAVGGWLGSYGGEDSPGDISRGLFAGEVGVPRVLELFRRAGIRHAVQRTPRARRIVVLRSVWFVTPSTLAACGPAAAMRTSVPVCCCDPGTFVVA